VGRAENENRNAHPPNRSEGNFVFGTGKRGVYRCVLPSAGVPTQFFTPNFNSLLIPSIAHNVFPTYLSRITFAFIIIMGQDSSVGITNCYGVDGPRIESRWGVGARFSATVQTGPGAHPASYTRGTGPFPGVKWPGRGVDYPPHLAARLNKE